MTPDRIYVVVALLASLMMLVGGASLLMLREAARRDLARRVQIVTGGGAFDDDDSARPLGSVIAGMLQNLGNAVRRGTQLYSDDDLASLEGMIAAAGYRPRQVLPIVLGVKVVMIVLVPVSAYVYCAVSGLAPLYRLAAVGMAVPLGLLLPDWILRILRGPYVNALRKGVSDALDLLVVCTEAGMGLESALDRVSREMRLSNRPMAAALVTLSDELRVLPDRKEALTNFGKRSGVEGIRRMSVMLAQTLQYGTPLGQALRAVAAELRRERMIRLEERAVRLPALMVFPLVFFILPSMFIIMGGIPLLGLLDLLAGVGGTGR